MDLKKLVLEGFRSTWKIALAEKFKDDPSKLAGADMQQVANDMFNHTVVKGSLGSLNVTAEDIGQVLCEVRDELLKEVDTNAEESGT